VDAILAVVEALGTVYRPVHISLSFPRFCNELKNAVIGILRRNRNVESTNGSEKTSLE